MSSSTESPHPTERRETCCLGREENTSPFVYIFFMGGIIALTVLLVGVTTALMILSELDEEYVYEKQFELDSSLFCKKFQNVFSRLNRQLRQLRAVLELSHHKHLSSDNDFYFEHPLSFAKWNKYLDTFAGNESPSENIFIGWIPQVPLEKWEEFMAYGRYLWNLKNFTVYDVTDDGSKIAVGIRPAYFPLLYLSPAIPDRLPINLASQPERMNAMKQAFQGDRPIFSEPINLVGNRRGVYLLLPVFDLERFPALQDRDLDYACASNQRESLLCEALLGFVTFVIRIDSTVEEAGDRLLRSHTSVVVTDLNASKVLTEYNACISLSRDDLQKSHVMEVNNRQWRIDIRHCEQDKKRISEFKWFILASAIVLTILILVSMVFLKKNTNKSLAAHRACVKAEAERESEERKRLLAEEERVEADAARVRAEEISLAKAKFLSDMNRELRTPLSGVVGTIDILQNTLRKEILSEHSENFEAISNCAEVLLSTVNDILDINKLMVGKMKIRETVSACMSTVRAAAAKKNLSVVTNMPEVARVILSDQSRISQIVLNFLSNAVKFTSENGHITTVLSWSKVEDRSEDRMPETRADIGITGESLSELVNECKSQREEKCEREGVAYYREQMILCVEDDGIGIAAGKLAVIFEPFEQADASVTRAYGGTGLGLSICQQLAQLLGGSVWVESTVGVGSKFYLSLPLEVVEEAHVGSLALQKEDVGNRRIQMIESVSEKTLKQKREDMYDEVGELPPRSSSSSSEEKTRLTQSSSLVEQHSLRRQKRGACRTKKTGLSRQFSGKCVLIVEDNVLNQRVFMKYLKNVGVEVTVANNGQLGVEEAKKKKFDLILMDCHMPVMDGYLACKHIREDEECANKSTPIIALTADVEASNKKKCEESGMVDFLTKPLQSNTLYRVMREHLELKGNNSH